MTCHNCARQTLGLFIRSFVDIASRPQTHRPIFSTAQSYRFVSTAPRSHGAYRETRRTIATTWNARESRQDAPADVEDDTVKPDTYERPSWQTQKVALKEKLGGQAWNPRKKLSPDTMEGIRHLHSTQPSRFTTPVLSQHFKVSPEAIRRILKSKWQPSDEEQEARMQRWDKRGERIWSNMVEMGVKPPKVWREMGVGRSTDGERPKWKGRRRLIDVRDSAGDNFVVEEGDIIPVVGKAGKTRQAAGIPISGRL